MATFNVNDIVESLVNAQCMRKGARYRVAGVHSVSNFTGVYTSYDLVDTLDNLALQHPVGNGHLVLKRVDGRFHVESRIVTPKLGDWHFEDAVDDEVIAKSIRDRIHRNDRGMRARVLDTSTQTPTEVL